MSGERERARSSGAGNTGSRAAYTLDATAIELATGLSIADVEALGSGSPSTVRADIAVKLACALDGLATRPMSRLAGDFLRVFSKDPEPLVRMRFADAVRKSPHLPPKIAERLARDEIDVAAPILRASPVLSDEVIGEIVETKPEVYALAISDRRPLSEPLVDLLIEHKGTRRVIFRLLDNNEAALSEGALLDFHERGRRDPVIAERLQRRPNLPFAFVDQCVTELADQVQWASLGKRIMTRFEATQLQDRFEGRTGHRSSSNGERFHRLYRALKDECDRGLLQPATLLAHLRDRDIDRLECGFAVMTGLDIKRVRSLLHGSDRRGLIALCLKAGFSTIDYLAFRMALTLAELGAVREQARLRYTEKNMRFACDQFEKMRADPHQLKGLLPPDQE